VIQQKGSIREQIDRRKFGPRMRCALRRVLVGETYAAAARAELVDKGYLWRAARTFSGLHEEHLRAWRSGYGADEFPKHWEHFLDRIGVRQTIEPNQTRH